MKLIGFYNKSIILTYIGAAVSILGIMNIDNMNIAMICLIAAGICDLFDGKAARMCKRNEQEQKFGIQIDSLADVCSFLLFPAVILFNSGLDSYAGLSFNLKAITYIIAVLYVLAGITRLGYFNVTTDGHTQYYRGLPVTYSALVFPVFYVVWRFFALPYYEIILHMLFLAAAVLYVLNIKIRKPAGIWYVIFSVIAVLTAALLVFMEKSLC